MDNTDPYKTKFKEERLYMSTDQNLMQHMRELIDRIKAADVAYYRDDNPTMTDREYDLLVDELKELETTTGLILSGSPTQTVSGEILKELTPVRHTTTAIQAPCWRASMTAIWRPLKTMPSTAAAVTELP